VFLVLRLRKADIERERRKRLTEAIYLSEAETIYWHFLNKFNKFKSRVGSVTIRVKGFPVSRRLYGDAVIRFLERHNIPFQVSLARKDKLRRVTVLDIPRLKQLIQPEKKEKVIEELYNIIKELLNMYSVEGLVNRKKRINKAKQEEN
jgi:hypothetical protein